MVAVAQLDTVSELKLWLVSLTALMTSKSLGGEAADTIATFCARPVVMYSSAICRDTSRTQEGDSNTVADLSVLPKADSQKCT